MSTAALLIQPQPALIPVLAPLALPAVFSLAHGRALVWGPRGWAWASLREGLEFRSFDDLLRAAAEQSQRAGERKGRSGWSLHKDRLLVVPKQPLRAMPLDTAPVLAELPSQWDAKTATFPRSSTEVPEPETLVLGANTTLPAVVKVAELRGDWAQVVLPDSDGLIVGNDGAGLLAKWQAAAAGWVKLKKAGPIDGTALNVWTTHAFGIGGVDY